MRTSSSRELRELSNWEAVLAITVLAVLGFIFVVGPVGLLFQFVLWRSVGVDTWFALDVIFGFLTLAMLVPVAIFITLLSFIGVAFPLFHA